MIKNGEWVRIFTALAFGIAGVAHWSYRGVLLASLVGLGIPIMILAVLWKQASIPFTAAALKAFWRKMLENDKENCRRIKAEKARRKMLKGSRRQIVS